MEISPVLSPMLFRSIPALFATVNSTFAIRGGICAANMLTALNSAVRLAGEEDRHALVVVHVRITDRAAVHHERMVEQVAVSIGVFFSLSRK